jgi:ABC-type thiamin/hydroxymethylpyrimidine transport system permease subunit
MFSQVHYIFHHSVTVIQWTMIGLQIFLGDIMFGIWGMTTRWWLTHR